MATMMKRSRQLSKCIVTPDRLAQILDWKRNARSVLALDITPQTVGMAVSSDLESHKVEALTPVTRYRVQWEEVTSKVQSLMDEYKVSALLVQWPMGPDGRLGKPCGHVLHVLDHLADYSESLISKRRPFALWTTKSFSTAHAKHFRRSCIGSLRLRDSETTADVWGRSQAFCLTEQDAQELRQGSEPMMYRSCMREEEGKIREGTSLGAQATLEGFLQTFWSTTNGNVGNEEWKDDFFAYRTSSDDSLLFPTSSSHNAAFSSDMQTTDTRAGTLTSSAHFLDDAQFIQSRLL